MKVSIEEIKHIAELGVLKTIPNFLTEPLKVGRLKGIFLEIEIIINTEIIKISKRNPHFYRDNKEAITYYLNEFGKKAKWIGNETHVASVISFCLVCLETSKFKYPNKLFALLNKATDYYERVGNIEHKDLYNAEDFVNIWETIEDYQVNRLSSKEEK